MEVAPGFKGMLYAALMRSNMIAYGIKKNYYLLEPIEMADLGIYRLH